MKNSKSCKSITFCFNTSATEGSFSILYFPNMKSLDDLNHEQFHITTYKIL